MEWNFEYEGENYTAKSPDGEQVIATSKSGSVLKLVNPRVLNATVNDIYQINSINDILCYIFNIEGRLAVKFALLDEREPSSVQKTTDSDGKLGDFRKATCPSCKHQWYINVSKIAKGLIIEDKCPRCNMFVKLKNV